MRHYDWIDQIINRFEDALEIISSNFNKNLRPTPKPKPDICVQLTESERKLSLSCLRVNHSGEIAAQALYLGQAMTARAPYLAATLKEAAKEEKDHLHWCQERISNLRGKTSYLNPIWAMGSFGIGLVAGLISDKISLGFLAETENQVVAHLDSHLARISLNDSASRTILLQMREDEAKHATMAIQEGGVRLPPPIKKFMQFTAKIMTTTSYYL